MINETLKAAYPELINDGTRSATLAAKNIRRALARRFPGIKFSVRTRYASCMSAVDISWTDGPAKSDVEEITDRHQYEDFDGMTDSSIHRTDGNDFRAAFGSARFVSCYREYSTDAIEFALSIAAEKFNAPVPTVEQFHYGVHRYGGNGIDSHMYTAATDFLEAR